MNSDSSYRPRVVARGRLQPVSRKRACPVLRHGVRASYDSSATVKKVGFNLDTGFRRYDGSDGLRVLYFLTFVIVLLCSPCVYAKEAVVTADKIISGDEISLQDGRIIRLSGIKALSPDAKDFLQSIVAGHEVTLQNATTDRYGRTDATVFVGGQSQPVENLLLQNGLSFVYPASGDDAALDEMLALEKKARREKRGYWAHHPDTQADHAEPLYGKYGFVSGVVTKAERVKNKIYLNFGADWRTDFTIAIAAHDLHLFKKQELDPLSWQGKHLRVRGWVKRDFGPMITVTDPHQIELE